MSLADKIERELNLFDLTSTDTMPMRLLVSEWREIIAALRALTDPALAELDAKATQGEWLITATDPPCHYEIGPSQRCMVAMMTNDGTDDNEFGLNNAQFIVALVNAYRKSKGGV